jgi:hypothetical protein
MTLNSSSEIKKPSRRSIIIGLRVFTSLAVLTIITLLILTASRETWKALLQVNPIYIPSILGLLTLYILFESTRIRLIVHAITGKWIPLGCSLQVIFCGAFLSVDSFRLFPAGYILWCFPIRCYAFSGGRIPPANIYLK